MSQVDPIPTGRREGLSRDRIVAAAIEILDSQGVEGLTFRSLAAALRTGHGAIQWHVANRAELLEAAAALALAPVRALRDDDGSPEAAVRAVALGVFDAIEAHPWLGSQLFAAPWQSATVGLWERVGRQIAALGVPEAALFTAASTLVGYVVGVGSQNTVNRRSVAPPGGRAEFVDLVATGWEGLDAAEFPFVRRMAARLRTHDDREEFVAGIDLILAGLARSGGA